jgi:predicted HicB family RNase H-like nuclease
MTITLQLKPEIEARLIAQAVLQGVSVEVYLESLIENSLVNQTEITFSETATYEEWEAALKDLVNSPSFVAPPLSDSAISRESIYTSYM